MSEQLPERKKQCLKLEEAASFLKKYSKDSEVEEKIRNKDEEIRSRIAEVKEMLVKLEKASVPRNIKESVAIETKVFGNRTAYITYVNLLLKKLDSGANDFERVFREFTEKSIKSYYATQYLFGKELQEVGKAIQELSRAFVERKKFQEELKKSRFRKIGEQIVLLQETLKSKSRIKNEIEIIEKELKKVEPLSTERKYIELKNSDEYHEAEKKKEEAEQLVRKSREEIVGFFSDIKRILKKANNKKRMWIVNYYIDEPIEALLEDKELKILSFIEGINREEIDEDLTPLKNVREERLKDLRSRYENALEAMKKVEKGSEIEKRVFELEDSLFRLNSQRTILQKKLDELRKRDEVNVDELKKEIENKLTEISGVLVELEI